MKKKLGFYILLVLQLIIPCNTWSYPAADSFDHDYFQGFEVVQPRKYSLVKKHLLKAHYTRLVGDKFLSTHGAGFGDTYFFNERWAIKGDLTFFRHFISKDVDYLKSKSINVRLSDPSILLRLSALYQPFYGKITAGSYIQQFFVGVELGAAISLEEEMVYKSINSLETGQDKVTFGPLLGLNILAPISKYYSIEYDFQYTTYNNPFEDFDVSKNVWVHTLGLGVRF